MGTDKPEDACGAESEALRFDTSGVGGAENKEDRGQGLHLERSSLGVSGSFGSRTVAGADAKSLQLDQAAPERPYMIFELARDVP